MRHDAVAFALLLVPTLCEAQSESQRIRLDVSNVAMERDTALISGAAYGVHRLVEIGLDKLLPRSRGDGGKAIALRAARLYLVSLPIASLSHTFIHEAGHVEHTRRAGADSHIRITQWPWPVPLTFAEGISDLPTLNLGIVAGGSEAAFLHESREADLVYESAQTHYFNWVAFAYAKLDTVLYIQRTLYEGRSLLHEGDPLSFVIEFERERAVHSPPESDLAYYFRLLDRSRTIRRQSWTALADLTLVSAVARTLQYAWTGERFSSPFALKIGETRIVPGWHFVLTPEGYEHRGTARFLLGERQGMIYFRHIKSPTFDDLDGIGGWWRIQLGSALKLSAEVDGWRRNRGGDGYRVSLGLRRLLRKGAGLEVGGTVGYKTKGYLEGHPTRASILLGISGVVRF